MITLLKRKIQFIATFLVGLSLPALLFPLHHFHPDNKHTPPGQLHVQEHQAHFHSAVLEAYAHYINAHPSDPELDAPFHQSHSTSGHEQDDAEAYTVQKNVVSTKAKLLAKVFDFSAPLRISRPLFPYQVTLEVLTFKSLEFFGPLSSRSPPSFLL